MSKAMLMSIGLLMLFPFAAQAQVPGKVILYIGDGVGVSYWTLARFASDDLAVNDFRIMGLVDTRASNTKITDSAAAATAYASGVRTYNGAIGVDADTTSVPTVLEQVRDRGWATGLVATSSVTHATPASFAAHVPLRAMEFEIARQLVESGVDVLLGGGLRWFSASTRPDGMDLVERLSRTHTAAMDADQLWSVDLDSTDRLFGLFAEDGMPPAALRTPGLPDMTRAAIEVLDHDEDGFFLMVEGSQPDWRGHDNEPVQIVTAEMLDFDRAIGVGLDYQRQHPETLIVVVADHETGGLALQLANDRTNMIETARALDEARVRLAGVAELLPEPRRTELRLVVDSLTASVVQLRRAARTTDRTVSLRAVYTTGGHTAQMIPLFASGPSAERFGGMIDNWRVGELLLELTSR
jgi:alkaline phosphatase